VLEEKGSSQGEIASLERARIRYQEKFSIIIRRSILGIRRRNGGKKRGRGGRRERGRG
jgi:hypothetical protein